jgi:type III secretory pathway component EscT
VSVPAADVATMVLAVALGAARTVPVTWLVSPLGGARLPATARLAFGLTLAALAAPALGAAVARVGLAHAGVGLVLVVVARELFVGFGLGFVVSLAFRAAETAGRLVDVLRGASLAEVLVPTSDERASPMGALYALLATLVFLELGGVPRLLEALLVSYQAVPLAGHVAPATLRAAAGVLVVSSARLLEASLGLAAPVVVALWLTDLALGMVARVAPAVPVYFVGLPAKGLLAVGVVLLGLGALDHALAAELPTWLDLARRWLSAWA